VRELSSAGAAFLLSVLWFDLMFDVQVRGHGTGELPPEVRGSITAYYARVTTAARPMNRLVAVVMLITIVALVVELGRDELALWRTTVSLVLTVAAVGLAVARTVPHAQRLGRATDDAGVQSTLARGILRDHLLCLGGIALVLVLQLVPA
jgi:hypothetical protein